MKITGIICEYNPLHLGHKKQIDIVHNANPDGGIVCLMSGNFVQRGTPAVFDKLLRAKAAVLSGADLVLELPVTAALSSAEGFADTGVSILSPFCQNLCFGAETADADKLMAIAQALLSPAFPQHLKTELDKGLSFPAARQAALEAMGADAALLTTPNNILAVEYCKAILQQNSQMTPYVIHRQGSYHDATPDKDNPSAAAIRALIVQGHEWKSYVPNSDVYDNAAIHSLNYGEQAILHRLRTMTDAEFEALPYGSEGLWRKLMHAARSQATLEDVLTATKSKRYTRSRLDRMVMCAFLGITKETLNAPLPYVRILAFNDKGREILKTARKTGEFRNIGEMIDSSYQQLENRCGDLYGLFANSPEAPGRESVYRVCYRK